MSESIRIAAISARSAEAWSPFSTGEDLELTLVSDPRSLRRLLNERTVDLIASDLTHPDIPLSAIVALRDTSQECTPILIWSDDQHASEARNATEAGADDYVLTSQLSRLPLTVRNLLRNAARERAMHHTLTKLQQSEEHFRYLIENVLDVITVTDINATIVYESPSLKRVLGYDPEELVGKNAFAYIHPLDIPKAMPIFMLAIATPGVPHSTRFRFKHKNGTWRQLEVVGKTHREPEGGLRLIVTSRDITDRERAEEALGQSEMRFRSVVEGLSEGLVITDTDSRVSYLNSRMTELFGYSPAEVIGKPFYQLILPPEVWEARKEWIAKAGNATAARHETQIRKKDGTLTWVEIHTTPFYDGDHITGTISAFVDISERKRIEQQLQQERLDAIEARDRAEEANRLKSHFLSNMSHELRTPLTSILGFAQIIRDTVNDPELQMYASMITSGGNRLLDTMSGLLDLSAIESDTLMLNRCVTDLRVEVCAVSEQLRSLAESKLLSWNVTIADEPAPANVDPHYMRESLRHILGNAIKFTEMGSIVLRCDVDHDSDEIEITICDTGVGIEPEFLPYIFDAFRQESSGFDRRFEGNGLGLTLTKHIIEAMGGTLTVESEKFKGSQFRIRLPLMQVPPRSYATTYPYLDSATRTTVRE